MLQPLKSSREVSVKTSAVCNLLDSLLRKRWAEKVMMEVLKWKKKRLQLLPQWPALQMCSACITSTQQSCCTFWFLCAEYCCDSYRAWHERKTLSNRPKVEEVPRERLSVWGPDWAETSGRSHNKERLIWSLGCKNDRTNTCKKESWHGVLWSRTLRLGLGVDSCGQLHDLVGPKMSADYNLTYHLNYFVSLFIYTGILCKERC